MLKGLLAMTPRQVLLSSSSSNNASSRKPRSLTPEERPLLLQAICSFLESNGFSKALKKLLSEASIERGSWKDCSLNVEEACSMYLDARSQNGTNDNDNKLEKNSEQIVSDGAKSKSKEKKKKKSTDDSTTETVEIHSKEPEAVLVDTSGQEKSSKKSKDKKKKKGSDSAPDLSNGDLKECAEEENKGKADPEKSSKSKSERKKNKESKTASSPPLDGTEKNGTGATDDQEKKSSKKRKKSSSEENESNGVTPATENSKRRKTDEQVTKDADKHLGNGNLDSQAPLSTNGNHSEALAGENGGGESALKKSKAKKQDGSAEPRALNAFQRVKADEVEFADDRLQDNSYWAKDGAEIGYGAKAQEVLGQVRGRDFRHEKTKKKRGSYRGGIIDFQSHSVKFNHSDEE